ncbi:MAG: hypothetical protein KME03_12840 [Aphanocapsa lilacina HA4352-LM1]|jgi:hypothetical protein|nr:hypothetical protein [Aphanocapsa lilacina HA4352-LM1]
MKKRFLGEGPGATADTGTTYGACTRAATSVIHDGAMQTQRAHAGEHCQVIRPIETYGLEISQQLLDCTLCVFGTQLRPRDAGHEPEILAKRLEAEVSFIASRNDALHDR